jgi:hypothetical protein
MARQADRLAKIGLEGFAAIDEHFGRAKRRPPVLKVPYVGPHARTGGVLIVAQRRVSTLTQYFTWFGKSAYIHGRESLY